MLAGSDFDIVLAEVGTDSGMTKDVIRGGGFLNEERLELRQMGQVRFCFGNRPDL